MAKNLVVGNIRYKIPCGGSYFDALNPSERTQPALSDEMEMQLPKNSISKMKIKYPCEQRAVSSTLVTH